MAKSRQKVEGSEVGGTIRQHSLAEEAVQEVRNSKASEIVQTAGVGTDKFAELGKELEALRVELQKEHAQGDVDSLVNLGAIASAEKAAKQGDGPAVTRHLKNAGKWALATAERMAVAVAVAAIKYALDD